MDTSFQGPPSDPWTGDPSEAGAKPGEAGESGSVVLKFNRMSEPSGSLVNHGLLSSTSWLSLYF